MAQLAQTSPKAHEKGPIPAIVWIILTTQLLIATFFLRRGILRLKRTLSR